MQCCTKPLHEAALTCVFASFDFLLPPSFRAPNIVLYADGRGRSLLTAAGSVIDPAGGVSPGAAPGGSGGRGGASTPGWRVDVLGPKPLESSGIVWLNDIEVRSGLRRFARVFVRQASTSRSCRSLMFVKI